MPDLAAIDELIPLPGNPRRGNLDALAESLSRFGQVRPVVISGSTIVAGNHIVEAARRLGWTHVGVVRAEFASEDELRRYALMDNRSHDLGDYDLRDLQAQLDQLSGFDGTGYGDEDLAALTRYVEQMEGEALAPPTAASLLAPRPGLRCPACGHEWSE